MWNVLTDKNMNIYRVHALENLANIFNQPNAQDNAITFKSSFCKNWVLILAGILILKTNRKFQHINNRYFFQN